MSLSLNFFEQFSHNVATDSERIAFLNISTAEKESFTYGAVDKEIRCLSLYLASQGIGKGHSVGIMMENHPRWGIAFLAAQSAGATIVPLDVLHTPKTLAKLIHHAECSLLFTSQKMLSVLAQIQETRSTPLPAIVAGNCEGQYPDWDQILEDLADEEIPLPIVEKSLDDPHMIMYTSGTTGNPKGVVLTGRNLYRNVVEALKLIQVTPQDTFLNVLPLYHILSLVVNFIIPLYCGSKVTFLDVLDAQKILKAFRDEGISVFVCVPQFFYLLHRRIAHEVDQQSWFKKFLFHRLLKLSGFCRRRLGVNLGKTMFRKIHELFGPAFRLFGVGGARFDPATARALFDLGFTILQAYGMTENAALATLTSSAGHGLGTVGRPLPHVEIKIDNPDSQGVGEVLIRGENVMPGYFKNEEATLQAIDAEGWLHTGDLGHCDSQGFLGITGRMKDVIVLSSGKNIFPEEVEHFYQSKCDFIKEMCVLGVQKDESVSGQEKLYAVIVPDFDRLRAEMVVNAYDMIRYMIETLSQQLPGYKRVRSFEIWQQALPRTTTTKLKRFEIENQIKSGQGQTEGEASSGTGEWEPEGPTESNVSELIQNIKGNSRIHPSMNLELDLGFDSLERVELISSVVEAFQFDISDDEATSLFTVQDLIDHVEGKLSAGSSGGSRKKSWQEILSEPLSSQDAEKVKDQLARRPFVELLFVLVAKTTLILSKILFRLKVTGLENLPKKYPFMICPNHLSYVDAFVVVAPLPASVVRKLFFLGYSDYFTGGIVGFLGRLIKTIPVDADRKLREALRLAAEGLQRQMALCVYPEGERSIDGELKVFRKGPAILATEMQVPVVPVGIRGTYEVWRRGSSQIRLHPVSVAFGKAILPEPAESVESFNQRLVEAVRELI